MFFTQFQSLYLNYQFVLTYYLLFHYFHNKRYSFLKIFLSYNSNIFVLSESDCDVCFVHSDCVFILPLVCFVIFCWKLDLLYWVIGTELNRPFILGFMIIWLRNGLCLLLIVAGTKPSNFSCVLVFVPLSQVFLHWYSYFPLTWDSKFARGGAKVAEISFSQWDKSLKNCFFPGEYTFVTGSTIGIFHNGHPFPFAVGARKKKSLRSLPWEFDSSKVKDHEGFLDGSVS